MAKVAIIKNKSLSCDGTAPFHPAEKYPEYPFGDVSKKSSVVVRHSRYVIFQMAEVAVPRQLFQEILDRIRQLKLMVIPSGVG
jgi:hypothetical protein